MAEREFRVFVHDDQPEESKRPMAARGRVDVMRVLVSA